MTDFYLISKVTDIPPGPPGAPGVEPPLFQCRVSIVGGNIVMNRFGGNKLFAGGANRVIPVEGVSLAPSGLTPCVNLGDIATYVYTGWADGVWHLESSLTAPSIDPVTGLLVKSDDSTRTPVAIVAPPSAAAWPTDPMLLVNYHNQRSLSHRRVLTSIRENASTYPAWSETHAELRIPFLCLAGDEPAAIFQGRVLNGFGGGKSYGGIAFDNGNTPEEGARMFYAKVANDTDNITVFSSKKGLAPGVLHYATHVGANYGANGSWIGSSEVGDRGSLYLTLLG